MSKKHVDMLVSNGRTIVRVKEGDSLACTSLDEKETIELFKDILEEYGYGVVSKW